MPPARWNGRAQPTPSSGEPMLKKLVLLIAVVAIGGLVAKKVTGK
jgi:hypothetical protein